jgi:hypothetical protein
MHSNDGLNRLQQVLGMSIHYAGKQTKDLARGLAAIYAFMMKDDNHESFVREFQVYLFPPHAR